MPYQVIYSSQASAPMSAADLERILVDARAGNETRHVTGVLVYVDGVFLQVLEGEQDVVLGLMRSISMDTRHGSVKVFYEAEVEAPMFGAWRMAYVHSSPEQMALWAGLPGATTIDSVVADIDRDPRKGVQFAAGLLKAIAA